MKILNFFSLDYSLGKLIPQTLLNFNLLDSYEQALADLGYDLHEVMQQEPRVCYGDAFSNQNVSELESLVSVEIPCWAYGIKYKYKQTSEQKSKLKIIESNMWEIKRSDVKYKVQFGGRVIK